MRDDKPIGATSAPFGLAPFAALVALALILPFVLVLNSCSATTDRTESPVISRSAPLSVGTSPRGPKNSVAVVRPTTPATVASTKIRVRLNAWRGQTSFGVVAHGDIRAYKGPDETPLSLAGLGSEFAISATAEGMAIGPHRLFDSTIRLEMADSSGMFRLKASPEAEAVPVRGCVAIHRTAAGELEIMLVLDLEDYVRGSLLAEMPERFGLEALKAQAVAIRTYGLYKIVENRHRGDKARAFDVQDTIADLCYGGLRYEKPIADAATVGTRGEVLTYGGRLFLAYFHSTSGGATESAAHIFGTFSHLPPLVGRRESVSDASPLHHWTRRHSWASVREKLIAAGASANVLGSTVRTVHRHFHTDIDAIPAANVADPARRPKSFEFVTDTGRYTIDAPKLRFAIGTGKTGMPSTACVIEVEGGDTLVFTGRGFGHGVGLCQYGAAAMGQSGRSYRDILAHFYPHSQLMRQ